MISSLCDYNFETWQHNVSLTIQIKIFSDYQEIFTTLKVAVGNKLCQELACFPEHFQDKFTIQLELAISLVLNNYIHKQCGRFQFLRKLVDTCSL